MINPGLASLVGDDEKGELHHSSRGQCNIFSRFFFRTGQLWKFPFLNYHTGQVSRFLSSTAPPWIQYFILSSLCVILCYFVTHSKLKSSHFLQHPCFLQVRLMTFSSLGFSSYPKILTFLFTANISPRGILVTRSIFLSRKLLFRVWDCTCS